MSIRVVYLTLAVIIVIGLIVFAVLASRGGNGTHDMPGMDMGLAVWSPSAR